MWSSPKDNSWCIKTIGQFNLPVACQLELLAKITVLQYLLHSFMVVKSKKNKLIRFSTCPFEMFKTHNIVLYSDILYFLNKICNKEITYVRKDTMFKT